MFIDSAKILVKSGNGGSGAVSFRREKYVPRGGPDGGDGGRGGHVILVVRDDLTTLSDFRYKHRFQAEDGAPGEASNRTGKNGADLYIPVPAGTIVKNAETQKVLADLTEPGSEFIVLSGGRGGRGNWHFASSTRQTPQFSEKGELGSEIWIELELKLLADVGLIGFPNAGKSTLLSKISAARPKIADYPFTTLVPNLGVVDFKGRSFVAVDIPGLIEGAHQGVGLGDQFLRHIERTRLLVHLVDISGFSGRDPYRDYLQINEELRLYNPDLAVKKQLVVATKIDLLGNRRLLESFGAQLNQEFFPISAATGEGIENLLKAVINNLAVIPKEAPPVKIAEPETRTADFTINVSKENEVFVVQNEALIKRIARYDLENDDSLRSLQRLLNRWGVEQALVDAGIKEGDSVRIGDFEFTFLKEE
ncbi:MAG: GTPase ObgE [Bacillota bacterium]